MCLLKFTRVSGVGDEDEDDGFLACAYKSWASSITCEKLMMNIDKGCFVGPFGKYINIIC